MLLAAGGWAVVYGGFYHRITVSENHPETQHEEPIHHHRAAHAAARAAGWAAGMPASPTDASATRYGSVPPPEAFAPPVKIIQAVKTTTSDMDSTSEESESPSIGP